MNLACERLQSMNIIGNQIRIWILLKYVVSPVWYQQLFLLLCPLRGQKKIPFPSPETLLDLLTLTFSLIFLLNYPSEVGRFWKKDCRIMREECVRQTAGVRLRVSRCVRKNKASHQHSEYRLVIIRLLANISNVRY